MPKIPEEHQEVVKDDYRVVLYPGFASRCAVKLKGQVGEKELYRQEEAYELPEGQKKPRARHQIHFEGGSNGRKLITLAIHDPGHHVASITIELHPEGYVSGSGQADPSNETFTIENISVTCPPECRVARPPARRRASKGRREDR
jgi:hypothetical protein